MFTSDESDTDLDQFPAEKFSSWRRPSQKRGDFYDVLLASIWSNTLKIAGELGVGPPRLS